MDKEKVIKPQEGSEPQITPEQERLFEQVIQEKSTESQSIEQLHSGQTSNVVPFEVPNSHSSGEVHHEVPGLPMGKKLTPVQSVEALNKLISGGGNMDPSDLVDSLAQIQDQTEEISSEMPSNVLPFKPRSKTQENIPDQLDKAA
jgi:hypothetical protein